MIPDKPWWASITFWGAVMVAVSLAVGNLFSIDLGDPQALAQQIVDFIYKALQVIGSFLAIIGLRRAVAKV